MLEQKSRPKTAALPEPITDDSNELHESPEPSLDKSDISANKSKSDLSANKSKSDLSAISAVTPPAIDKGSSSTQYNMQTLNQQEHVANDVAETLKEIEDLKAESSQFSFNFNQTNLKM